MCTYADYAPFYRCGKCRKPPVKTKVDDCGHKHCFRSSAHEQWDQTTHGNLCPRTCTDPWDLQNPVDHDSDWDTHVDVYSPCIVCERPRQFRGLRR
ncbi:hypothetical protein AURDEDRAFT_161481 [Auricularia subglabra TFB-10046 SS5]|nr:hypothetical protein AURDEDRAFT_161481 [Auricularia subglabra TFB-10046 SS5]